MIRIRMYVYVYKGESFVRTRYLQGREVLRTCSHSHIPILWSHQQVYSKASGLVCDIIHYHECGELKRNRCLPLHKSYIFSEFYLFLVAPMALLFNFAAFFDVLIVESNIPVRFMFSKLSVSIYFTSRLFGVIPSTY